MTKKIFLLIAILILNACSFSKDEPSPLKAEIKENSRALSKNQTELLKAARNGNIEKIELVAGISSIDDLSFKDLAVTPMLEAMRADNLDVAEALLRLKIDPFNLGLGQEQFNRKLISFVNSQALASLSHHAKDEKDFSLNSVEIFLYKKQNEVLKTLLEQIETNSSPSMNLMSQISCPFIEGALILESISTKSSSLKNFEKIITLSRCKDSLGVDEVHIVYQTALIREFQNSFKTLDTLKYIVRHKNFVDQMWNIDNSNILVSPPLLYRIRFNFRNILLSQQILEDFDESQNFLNEINLPNPEFELIDARDKERVFSFTHFVFQSEGRTEDLFFKKVFFFMHGKKAYVGTPDENPRIWHDTTQEINWDMMFWQEQRFLPPWDPL